MLLNKNVEKLSYTKRTDCRRAIVDAHFGHRIRPPSQLGPNLFSDAIELLLHELVGLSVEASQVLLDGVCGYGSKQ